MNTLEHPYVAVTSPLVDIYGCEYDRLTDVAFMEGEGGGRNWEVGCWTQNRWEVD